MYNYAIVSVSVQDTIVLPLHCIHDLCFMFHTSRIFAACFSTNTDNSNKKALTISGSIFKIYLRVPPLIALAYQYGTSFWSGKLEVRVLNPIPRLKLMRPNGELAEIYLKVCRTPNVPDAKQPSERSCGKMGKKYYHNIWR